MPKISELPDAAAVDGAEEIPVVQSGTTKRMTINELLALAANATQAELDAAITALSGTYQPLDSDLTALAALTTPATTVTGAAQKASNLSDLANAATAFGNIKQAASESATGVVEMATVAEASAGTDTARAVTAAGIKAFADAQSIFIGPGEINPTSTGAFPSRLQVAKVTGGSAGDLTCTGIDATDLLISVIRLNRDGTAANIDIADLTSEFSISADNTINNTGGTDTTGDSLLVLWTGGNTLGSLALDQNITESFSVAKPVPASWGGVDVYVWALTGSGTGNAIMQGDPFGTGAVESTLTIAGPFTPVRHRVVANGLIVPVSGTDRALCQARIDRLGGDGDDTLADDLIVMTAELAKPT